ncbi:MAG: hypothetical protein ACFFAN_17640 [Promethearchaeota archaeon]
MLISISNTLKNQLEKDYKEILSYLIKNNYQIQKLPIKSEVKKEFGEAFTIAYPIQGVLKYHGFANSEDRIAFFPSISLCNDCAFTVSYLKFDKSLKDDCAYLNGEQVFDNKLERIKLALNYIRNYSKIKTKAILVSRNFFKVIK